MSVRPKNMVLYLYRFGHYGFRCPGQHYAPVERLGRAAQGLRTAGGAGSQRTASHRGGLYGTPEPSDHTLQATEVAHDAYLKLVDQPDHSWQSRGHFFAAAAKTMRRMLVDHGRKRRSIKRGGAGKRVDLDEVGNATTADRDELLALDQALTRLEHIDKRQHDIVELRYFAGLKEERLPGCPEYFVAHCEAGLDGGPAMASCRAHSSVFPATPSPPFRR